MANPNIISASSAFGEVEQYNPTTTESSATTNPAASGEVFRVESIHIANTSGADQTITVKHRTTVSGTPTVIFLASTMTVATNAALQILSVPIWLKEDQDIRLLASTDNTLDVTISYTRIVT